MWLGLGILMISYIYILKGLLCDKSLKLWKFKPLEEAILCIRLLIITFVLLLPLQVGGQPMVAYYMSKDGLSLSHISLTLLMNTALFKIILLVLSIICICICPQYVFDFPIMTILFFIGLAINLILISMCFLAAFKRNWIQAVGIRLILFLARHRIIKKKIQVIRRFVNLMEKYEQGAHLIFKHKFHFLKALLYNLLQRISFFQ